MLRPGEIIFALFAEILLQGRFLNFLCFVLLENFGLLSFFSRLPFNAVSAYQVFQIRVHAHHIHSILFAAFIASYCNVCVFFYVLTFSKKSLIIIFKYYDFIFKVSYISKKLVIFS